MFFVKFITIPFVKFNKTEKIVGQIRGKNIGKGGSITFSQFFIVPFEVNLKRRLREIKFRTPSPPSYITEHIFFW